MTNASNILTQRPAIALAVLTFVFILGFAPKAHAEQHCSNASLRGMYGFHSFSTEVPTGTLRNVIAVYAFDGRGSWTATLTVNVNGSVFQFPDAGTYQVNPDCTGKLVLNSGGSQAAVVVDGGKELYLMRTDPSSIVQYGTGKRLFPGE